MNLENQLKAEKGLLVKALLFRGRLDKLIERTQGTVDLKEQFKLMNMKINIEENIVLLEGDIKMLEKEVENHE